MVDGCGLDLLIVSLWCVAAWVIWSKPLASGAKPMREEVESIGVDCGTRV